MEDITILRPKDIIHKHICRPRNCLCILPWLDCGVSVVAKSLRQENVCQPQECCCISHLGSFSSLWRNPVFIFIFVNQPMLHSTPLAAMWEISRFMKRKALFVNKIVDRAIDDVSFPDCIVRYWVWRRTCIWNTFVNHTSIDVCPSLVCFFFEAKVCLHNYLYETTNSSSISPWDGMGDITILKQKTLFVIAFFGQAIADVSFPGSIMRYQLWRGTRSEIFLSTTRALMYIFPLVVSLFFFRGGNPDTQLSLSTNQSFIYSPLGRHGRYHNFCVEGHCS